MKLEDLEFDLPPERIAQTPASPRDASRLLVLGRSSGMLRHVFFRDLADELDAGDLLVVNDTRVRPARVSGTKETGGRVEMLLREPAEEPETWRCLLDASRPPRPGTNLRLAGGLRAEVAGRSGATWTVRLGSEDGSDPLDLVERFGEVPLPPYIHREPDDPRRALDRERYQTVYARVSGSAAAPTAGLHFTPTLLADLGRRGVGRATVTLHVGIGTFLPLRKAQWDSRRLHAEWFSIPPGTVEAVARTRAGGGRVVAVGTTTVRALESGASEDGRLAETAGRTNLFIRPGYRFRIVDALVTNFHLPRSSLLAMVFAFAGRERVLGAYREAIAAEYRFYSYGDAMLILDPGSNR